MATWIGYKEYGATRGSVEASCARNTPSWMACNSPSPIRGALFIMWDDSELDVRADGQLPRAR